MRKPNSHLICWNRETLRKVPQFRRLPAKVQHGVEIASCVIPFRVSKYVVDELIQWSACPNDPIFQLTFPQAEMLDASDFDNIARCIHDHRPELELNSLIADIHSRMNPHPEDQLTLNKAESSSNGIQRQYKTTALVFPTAGQTCHSYCTYCFRWAQFVGDRQLRMAESKDEVFWKFLAANTDLTDVLITGGDPMVMSYHHLGRILHRLTSPEFEHIKTVRLGTKALSYWPYRFVTESDSLAILGLFADLVGAKKHVAIMSHFSHPRELETPIVREAIKGINRTGAVIRSQEPLARHVNADADTWVELWKREISLGIVPYYMFIMRDTGPRKYFDVTLAKAVDIYRSAQSRLSGLARTARGPVMSTSPGKIVIDGIADIHNEKVFCLRFLQGRNVQWANRPFFASFDPNATWFDDLKPAFGAEKFFFEDDFNQLKRNASVIRTGTSTGAVVDATESEVIQD